MSGLGRLGGAFGRLGAFMKGVVILGAGILGFTLLMVFRPQPPHQEVPRRAPLVATTPADVRSGFLTVYGNGTVRPRSEIVLSPQVGGRVEWVSPDLVSGGRFRAGEPLFRIEVADYQNAVDRAVAEVAQRQVEVIQWEEERELALEEYERLQRREGIDTAVDSNDLGSLIFREPQLAAARANLKRAEAGLRDAELSVQRTRVGVPFDGIVRSETVDRGQYVVPGQSVARVYATDEAEIVVPLTDREASLVAGLWDTHREENAKRIAATVTGTFGGREYAWDGYLDRAEGALNEETRTIDVVVRVPNPFDTEPGSERPPLLLGTYVAVEIRGAELDHYVVVPRSAYRDGDVLWVVESDSVLRVTPASFIQEIGGSVFLDADIREGDHVIVSPIEVVTDGMIVRVAEDSSS